MSQITAAFVQQFQDNILLLSQQKASRLRDSVYVKVITGNAVYFERLAPMEASLRVSRNAPSPLSQPDHSRRRCTMEDWELGMAVDKQDEIRILIDPQSSYAQNFASSMGRKIDDQVILNANGNATAVTSSLTGTTSQVGLPSTQIISPDFGTSTSNLTVPKLIEARRLFAKNEVDLDSDMLTLVLNASGIASLLNTTQVTSADYNTVKTLVNGDIDTFMGFKIVRSERLQGTPDGTDTAPMQLLAFAKSGIGLAMGQDITVRIQERADLGFADYVYVSMTLGAVRIEDVKVVQINCAQAA